VIVMSFAHFYHKVLVLTSVEDWPNLTLSSCSMVSRALLGRMRAQRASVLTDELTCPRRICTTTI
jgi:hypothetical protein